MADSKGITGKSGAKTDIANLTTKDLRKRVTDTLVKGGYNNRFVIANFLTLLFAGQIIHEAIVALRKAVFTDREWIPSNDVEYDYSDLLNREIVRAQGAVTPDMRPYLRKASRLHHFDWSRIATDVAAGRLTDDAKGALTLGALDDGSGLMGKANVIDAIWSFIDGQMPRAYKVVPAMGADGVQETETADDGTVTLKTKVVPRFGYLSGTTPVAEDVDKWRKVKRLVRVRTLADLACEATLTTEWFCALILDMYQEPYSAKVNAKSGAIRFVHGATDDAAADLTPIDKLRSFLRGFNATIGMGGLTGLYFIDQIPADKVDSAIGAAKALGFDARLIVKGDKGIEGQIRVSVPLESGGVPTAEDGAFEAYLSQAAQAAGEAAKLAALDAEISASADVPLVTE